MKRYRFSITIIEDLEDRCTKVFEKQSVSKREFITHYIEALALYNKCATPEENQEFIEETQKALF